MLILVLGAEKSGKSRFAEGLSVKINEGGLFYIATMIPAGDGETGAARIARHRAQREGLGFETIEKPIALAELDIGKDSTVLLEDAQNLLANYMFGDGANAVMGGADIAFDDIEKLARKCGNLVVVSLKGLSQSEKFDSATNKYIAELELLNSRIYELADAVFIAGNGGISINKGECPQAEPTF